MKIGLTSYSLNADIMSGRKTILDAMRFAAENGAEHMEIVPFGFTLYDDGRDEFNQPLIDSIRQTAEALSLPLSDYAVRRTCSPRRRKHAGRKSGASSGTSTLPTGWAFP